ncbi:MAG: hypothetical protein J6T63_08530 [Bacteroidales bacterium]|nr:hypothetical protein [Bacteroidales bacterium]
MEKAFKDVVSDKLCDFINSKKLSSRQMYEKIGCPTIGREFERIDFSYNNHLSALKKLVEENRILLADSSWGKDEAKSDKCKDTKPGVDDMHPDSFGYNNVGGPTYKITLCKEGVEVEVNFCEQNISGYSTMDISYNWQTRTFVFMPIDGDESSLDAMLDVFWRWIALRFLNWSLDKVLNEQAERLVSNFIKENFENE